MNVMDFFGASTPYADDALGRLALAAYVDDWCFGFIRGARDHGAVVWMAGSRGRAKA